MFSIATSLLIIRTVFFSHNLVNQNNKTSEMKMFFTVFYNVFLVITTVCFDVHTNFEVERFYVMNVLSVIFCCVVIVRYNSNLI